MNPRHLAVVLSYLLVAAVALGLMRLPGDGGGARAGAGVGRPVSRPSGAGPVLPEVMALDLLRAWDARRARAWARGSPAALAGLYTPGSRTGLGDRRMLRAYADRGLRVTGLRMQVLAVEVRVAGQDRLVLRVADRLARGVARGRAGPVPLPTDRVSVRLVELRRVAGAWRVGEVRDQPRPAARTASTSGSANR